jgi:hypothetical protein
MHEKNLREINDYVQYSPDRSKEKKTEIIEEKLSTYKFMISTTVIALS